MMKKSTTAWLYILLFLFSAAFIVVGNRIASKNAVMFTGQTNYYSETIIARADAILSVKESEKRLGDSFVMIETNVIFSCTVLAGAREGDTLVVTQNYDTLTGTKPPQIRAGDKLFVYPDPSDETKYIAGNLIRSEIIAVAAAVFFILLVLFARIKGLATIVALGFSVLSIFLVFIPGILSGFNVYLLAILICIYTILITPFFIGGFSVKSLASIIGCVGGVAVAGVLTFALNAVMRITGSVDEETMMVVHILEKPIDLQAITFAAIIVGALGATLDVSMSISSAVCELNGAGERQSFRGLLDFGMNIGRDIIGTQTSTLVLAYIGGSMSLVLLLVAYQNSVYEMLNLEIVVIELLQALIGGFTILFTIPATALICAWMVGRSAPVRDRGKRTFRA